MLQLIGFVGDDTLWRSEDYYRRANEAFVDIVGRHVDLGDSHVNDMMLATERRNLGLFGYGAKGMTLSMVESAIAITEGRISVAEIPQLVEVGKRVLQHPVELLPGIREAIEEVARHHDVILITKGDLFHQERKVAQSGLADLFRRIEIVSEKDAATYLRVLSEFDLQPGQFAMVGNSLRSDVEPVVRLGSWGVHLPYHVTWAHEMETGLRDDERSKVITIDAPSAIAAAVAKLRELAAA